MKGLLRTGLRVLSLTPLPILLKIGCAYAHDCGRRLSRVGHLINAPQTVLEDCMRTGVAQAIATGIVAAVGGAAIAAAVAKTLSEPEQNGTEEHEAGEANELRTYSFRIRLWSSKGISIGIGLSKITFEIEQWDGIQWTNRRRISMSTLGGGGGGKVEWLSSSSVWNEFDMPERMSIGEFDGLAGGVTSGPGVTLIHRAISASTMTVVSITPPNGQTKNIDFQTNSNGISFTIWTAAAGQWNVE